MAALGVPGLLTACTTGPASRSPPTAPAVPAGVRVTGTVSYLQRIALPPGSEVIVRLRDLSHLSGATGVVAEQRFMACSQVPLSFELAVDPGKTDPRMLYAVAARIQRYGK